MILGEKIRLRAPERSDLPNFVAWLNDPEVTRGLLIYLPLSMADEENWFTNMTNAPAAEHPMVMEVLDGDVWVPIGNIGFHAIDWRCRSAEVGIFIGEKSCWNRGYGTEAMQMMLRHAFNTLNLNRVHLQVHADNPRAIRSYEKVGFVSEGRKRQGMYKDGEYVDIVLMSILRSEWQDQHCE